MNTSTDDRAAHGAGHDVHLPRHGLARRVLVVDDEQLIRWSLVQRLRDDGYEITEAATAAEALERAEQGVDLALLDYKLPDEDGLVVLQETARTRPRHAGDHADRPHAAWRRSSRP